VPVGGAGTWDTAFREIGNVLHDPGDPDPSRRYKQLYSGYSGSYVGTQVYLGYNSSPDGVTWTKRTTAAPLIARALEDPYLVKVAGVYHIYAEDKADSPFKNIRHYTSIDFVTWVDQGDCFDIAASGWDSMDVSSPVVWHEGGVFWMLYEGRSATQGGAAGLAQSPDGHAFTRVQGDPVVKNNTMPSPTLTWASSAVPDDLLIVNGQYLMLLHAYSTAFVPVLVVSKDKVNWTDPFGRGVIAGEGVAELSGGADVMFSRYGNGVLEVIYPDTQGLKLSRVPLSFGGAAAATAVPADMYLGFRGKPAASDTDRVPFVRSTTIRAAPTYTAKADIAATAQAVFTLYRVTGAGASTQVGTLTYAANSAAGVLSWTTAVTFASGDELVLTAPASQDATLQSPRLMLAGNT